jgi:hypothetical protein
MPLTEDEQKALDERINEMVNKGVHGALSDFGRKQAEARKKDLETGLAEFGTAPIASPATPSSKASSSAPAPAPMPPSGPSLTKSNSPTTSSIASPNPPKPSSI